MTREQTGLLAVSALAAYVLGDDGIDAIAHGDDPQLGEKEQAALGACGWLQHYFLRKITPEQMEEMGGTFTEAVIRRACTDSDDSDDIDTDDLIAGLEAMLAETPPGEDF